MSFIPFFAHGAAHHAGGLSALRPAREQQQCQRWRYGRERGACRRTHAAPPRAAPEHSVPPFADVHHAHRLVRYGAWRPRGHQAPRTPCKASFVGWQPAKSKPECRKRTALLRARGTTRAPPPLPPPPRWRGRATRRGPLPPFIAAPLSHARAARVPRACGAPSACVRARPRHTRYGAGAGVAREPRGVEGGSDGVKHRVCGRALSRVPALPWLRPLPGILRHRSRRRHRAAGGAAPPRGKTAARSLRTPRPRGALRHVAFPREEVLLQARRAARRGRRRALGGASKALYVHVRVRRGHGCAHRFLAGTPHPRQSTVHGRSHASGRMRARVSADMRTAPHNHFISCV